MPNKDEKISGTLVGMAINAAMLTAVLTGHYSKAVLAGILVVCLIANVIILAAAAAD